MVSSTSPTAASMKVTGSMISSMARGRSSYKTESSTKAIGFSTKSTVSARRLMQMGVATKANGRTCKRMAKES